MPKHMNENFKKMSKKKDMYDESEDADIMQKKSGKSKSKKKGKK